MSRSCIRVYVNADGKRNVDELFISFWGRGLEIKRYFIQTEVGTLVNHCGILENGSMFIRLFIVHAILYRTFLFQGSQYG